MHRIPYLKLFISIYTVYNLSASCTYKLAYIIQKARNSIITNSVTKCASKNDTNPEGCSCMTHANVLVLVSSQVHSPCHTRRLITLPLFTVIIQQVGKAVVEPRDIVHEGAVFSFLGSNAVSTVAVGGPLFI